MRLGGAPHKGQIRSHRPGGRQIVLTCHRRGGWYFKDAGIHSQSSGWVNDSCIARLYPWVHDF